MQKLNLSPIISGVILGQSFTVLYNYKKNKQNYIEIEKSIDTLNNIETELISLNSESQIDKISELQQNQKKLKEHFQFTQYYNKEVFNNPTIPLYFASIFGSLFVPKIMLGLVAADLGARVGLSWYFQDTVEGKSGSYKVTTLENNEFYIMMNLITLGIIVSGPAIPLKFIMSRKF